MRVAILVSNTHIRKQAINIVVSKIKNMKVAECPEIEILTPEDFAIPVITCYGVEYANAIIVCDYFFPSYKALTEGFDGLDIKRQIAGTKGFQCFEESISEVVRIMMSFIKEVGNGTTED